MIEKGSGTKRSLLRYRRKYMIGKKTVLDYILKPVLKAKQNALREK